MTMDIVAGAPALLQVSGGHDRFRAHEHVVQLYDDDVALLDALERFIGEALEAGDSAVVCATMAHRDQLNHRLYRRGIDLSAAIRQGRYQVDDASDILTRILCDGSPNFDRFQAVIGELIDRAAFTVHGDLSRVVVFGELVAVVAASGDHTAAIALEQFWNALAQTRPFRLYCAYPLAVFAHASHGDVLRRICAAHSAVIPAESFTSLDGDAKHMAIVLLQQKALALAAEISERQRAEAQLTQREAELSAFVELVPVALHWVGADGTIVWANQAELELLGYARDEYIGRHLADLYIDPAVAADLLERLARHDAVREYAAQKRRKDGIVLDVLIDANGMWRDGEVVHTNFVTRDMTDRTRADVAMARLAAIIDSSDDAIVGKTLDGTITSWNHGAERLFGYRADEIVGRSIRTIVPPERQAEETSILKRLARGERITHFETERVRKDGTRVEVSVSISPIHDRHGRVVGASKIARDVSERHALERQKQEFLEMVAHDLGSPLTVISGYTQLLQRRGTYDERAVTAIATHGERMRRLVADMLDMTRLEAGRLALKRAPVNLVELVEEVVAQVALLADRRTLRSDVPTHPIVGEWDRDRLVQVLTNLLENALKYAPDGDIIVRVSDRPEGAQVSVIDQGPGLEPSELARVFDHFYRSTRTASAVKGAGLGLFICKAIIDGHGGRIWAASTPGHGTTFAFTLPTAVAAP
jgi:PAS domain S-box-containing protein